ncbi:MULTISPECIES: DEAD/DEAH box helicase [unclassified Schlesneria]|uniref:DEAD/DEAH box helicase n=1 Tax=Schlesneria TaxID=656899 RepID=UPI002F0EF338
MTHKLFSDLGLSPDLLKSIERMGFEQASPIQAEAIPQILTGRDVIGQSQTGSGKTAAFGIPAVEMADPTNRDVQIVMMCPTRELASQVAEEISKLAHFKKGIRELPIFGGQSYEHQFRGLKAGPQIVIGTPGRLIDHIKQGTLKLSGVKMIVLDEADRMLDMGFRDDIEKILEAIPSERQIVLFSATLPPPIRKIIERFTKDPITVRIEATAMSVPAIEQSYVEVDYRSKTEVLCRLLDLHDVRYGLVFGFTKIQVDTLTEALTARGYSCDKLHGDMTQPMRERTMKRFRERKIDLLVATDVAARGLDVDDLEIVFNYELPHDAEDYVHRIGRTGRAGKSGKAISLVSGREFGRLQQIIRFTKAKINRVSVPRLEELELKHASRLVESLHNTIQSGEFKPQDKLLEDLIEAGHAPGEIISALMHMLAGESNRAPERIAEDDPRPPRRSHRDHPFDQRDQRGPRGDRDDGPPRMTRPRESTGRGQYDGPPSRVDDSGVWIKFNVGDNAGVSPGDFVGCIANEAGVPRTVIGNIQILQTVSFVQVAAEAAEQILGAVQGVRLRGRRVQAMPGTPPRRDFRPGRDEGPNRRGNRN